MIPLIVIEGPTASGKSKVAKRLAEKIRTEIISADSRQIYRYMDIGTAKPSSEIREKIVHHMIDIVNPDQDYSAGQFAEEAGIIINQLRNEEKIPIVCGGTGFYIKALLEGLFTAPPIPEKIKHDLASLEESKGTAYLYGMLEKVDPQSANRLHPNDSYRIKRALEVWIATGKSIGEHWQIQDEDRSRYDTFRIMVTRDREELYERINQRLEKMIEDGLIDEIRSLLDAGYQEKDPGMTSVGYKEMIPFVKENTPFLSCLEEAKKNSRNYAKRQFTWYRRINFDQIIQDSEFDIANLGEQIKMFLDKGKKTLS